LRFALPPPWADLAFAGFGLTCADLDLACFGFAGRCTAALGRLDFGFARADCGLARAGFAWLGLTFADRAAFGLKVRYELALGCPLGFDPEALDFPSLELPAFALPAFALSPAGFGGVRRA
jgi:hypothetical protein